MIGWAQNLSAQHTNIFALAEDANELCQTSMLELEPHSQDVQEMLVATLYLRVVSNYQGVVLLLERGMVPEARVLARAMLEAIFTLVALANKPELAKDYVYEDHHSRLKFLRKHKQLHGGKLPNDGSEAEILALEKELKNDINVQQSKTRTTEKWAEEAGLLPWYLTAYALLSTSVHSKVKDLERYLIFDKKGEIREFKWGPDDTGMNLIFITIIEGLLVSFKSVLKVFGKDKNEQVEGLLTRLKPFVEIEKKNKL